MNIYLFIFLLCVVFKENYPEKACEKSYVESRMRLCLAEKVQDKSKRLEESKNGIYIVHYHIIMKIYLYRKVAETFPTTKNWIYC